jgi:hypothetical protein
MSGEQGTRDRILQRSRRAVNRNSVLVFGVLALSGPWLPGVADFIGAVVLTIGVLLVLGLLLYLVKGVFD